MKTTAFALLALCALAVAVSNPKLPESFQSEIDVELSVDGTLVHGKGIWAVNQVLGASIQLINFAESPANNVHITHRDGYRFEAEQSQNGACFAVPQSYLEAVFTHARSGELAGTRVVGNTTMDTWVTKTETEMLSLTVPRSDDWESDNSIPKPCSLTVVTAETGRRITYTFTSFSWELVSNIEYFARPAGCPMLLAQAEEEAPEVRFLNVTVNSMAQVLAKAREICTCGCPYVWGGNGPCCGGGRSGYDCSGMTTRSYAVGGVSIPRTAAGQQGIGKACAGGIRAGDLIFWGRPAHHVVMALSAGQWAECPHTGLNCRLTPARGYDGGCKRVL